jgi:hypothetical protein
MPRSYTRRGGLGQRTIFADHVNELQVGLEEDDVRITDIEADVAGMPDAADLTALQTDVATVETAVVRVDPGTAGAAGQKLARGITGPVWVNGLLNIMEYGAVDSAAVDDTAAFDAAWAAAIAQRKGLYIPPGSFKYTGTGLTGHQYPTIVGHGSGISNITLGVTSYLLAPGAVTSTLYLGGVGIYSGYGAIQHTYTGINVQQMHLVENCYFSGYTRACVEANASDFPYWKFRNCQFYGADTLLTMGIALPGLTDQDSIIDCSFLRNRVNVKLYGGGDNAEVLNCDFLRFSTNRTNGPCTDVWIVPQPTSVNAGSGLVIRDSKFGNENLIAGDFRILVADEDTGATFGQRFPKATIASTGYWIGALIEANMWASSGTLDDPFIFSTTPNLMGVKVGPISGMSLVDTAYVVEFLNPAAVLPDRNNQSTTAGPIYSSTHATETKPALRLSNAPGAVLPVDDNYILRTRPGMPLIGTGTPANYRDLLAADTTTFSVISGSSKVNTTDALGGTNACTVTFPTNSQFYRAVSAMTVGQPVWVEFDVGDTGGTDLAEIQVYVRDTNAAYHWRRTVEVPAAGWQTYKFPFVPRTVGTSINVHFHNVTGATGTVNIGRVRVYHATEALVGGHRVAANPDTSGAALVDLETEVNQLKEALRSLGLMAR